MGIDDQTEYTCRVYWPKKHSVTVECNVYFEPTAGHSCEEQDHPVDHTVLAYVPSSGPPIANPPPSKSTPMSSPESFTSLAPPVGPNPDDQPRPKCIRKPSQRVLDIMAGKAADSTLPCSVQLPDPIAESPDLDQGPAVLEGEGMAHQILAVHNYDDDIELVLALNEYIAGTEALEPDLLAEAKRHPDWPQWEQGIREELATLHKAGMWELVDLLKNANLIGLKWVFHAKKDATGNVVHYKAWLVAQGFSQVPGVDYFDTYAPVAKLASIRTVLALAARQDMELHQVDIKGAYLNGELAYNECIYMCQPPGYADPVYPQRVCFLRKMLYGLKQSGCRWYQARGDTRRQTWLQAM